MPSALRRELAPLRLGERFRLSSIPPSFGPAAPHPSLPRVLGSRRGPTSSWWLLGDTVPGTRVGKEVCSPVRHSLLFLPIPILCVFCTHAKPETLTDMW